MKSTMARLPLGAVSGLAAMALLAVPPAGAESFYKGKTIELAIGGSPGGGYDTYGRTVARHIGKYIPGNPTIVPKNRPGAGSRKAAAWLYSVAPKDGTAIAILFPGAIMDPVIRPKKAKFDTTKFNFLGSANRESRTCISWHTSPVKTFKDLFTKPLIVSGSARGGSSRDFPNFLNNLLGTKFTIVRGYKGTKTMLLAIERGETQGLCGYAWTSFNLQRPDWIKEGKVNILVQLAMAPTAGMTKLGVPMIWDFVKSKEHREIMEFFFKQQEFGRPFVAPPGVPAKRLAVLRKAFMAVLKDDDLLKDAKKSRIVINPVSGEEVNKLVLELFALPKSRIKRTIAATKFKKKK